MEKKMDDNMGARIMELFLGSLHSKNLGQVLTGIFLK